MGLALALVVGFMLLWVVCLGTHVLYNRPDLAHAPVVYADSATWHDGDLLLMQHDVYNLTMPIACDIPVHLGIVWVHPTLGPCFVDSHMSQKPTDIFQDALSNRGSTVGTRVMRIADFMRVYQGTVYRRPRTGGHIEPAAMAAAVEWAREQPFDSFVANGRPLIIAGICTSTMFPTASRALMHAGGPMYDATNARLRGMFCTELVAEILKRVSALDPAFVSHIASPLAFTSSMAHIDVAAAALPARLTWGREERVLAGVADKRVRLSGSRRASTA